MNPEPELICRLALGAMFIGTATIGIPFRIRADRAGGRVSTQVDPRWFWRTMLIVGPPMVLTCIAFLIEPRWSDFARFPAPSTSMPRDSAKLVTSGPYRWIRHPMYSAALILVLAATLLTSNVVVLVGGITMFVLLAARSRLEEQRLIEKFGEAYRDYQHHTGRFVPRLTGGTP
jgi:protein-S-isoprenylcysteine O-methyltransferase Ste14